MHIITGLGDGGAEAQLYGFCSFDKLNSHYVVSLLDEGKYGHFLRMKNIPVFCLNMKSLKNCLIACLKLFKIFKEINPNIVQTWMYHADFFGGLIGRLAGNNNIVWGIHNSVLHANLSKKSTIFLTKILAKFSYYIPKKIICCSYSSLSHHIKIGYKPQILIFVPNGYDLKVFFCDPEKRFIFRNNLNLKPNVPVLGNVSRFHPIKDHYNLILGLNDLKNKGINFVALFFGKGVDDKNTEICNLINELGLNKEIKLMGQSDEIQAVMNGIDIHILSSTSEAFPNVICEAMACKTPCISTDVGDAKFIIDKTGWIVPAKNPKLLAEAIENAIKEINSIEWLIRRNNSHNRILENFTIDLMVNRYNEVWEDVLKR